MRASPHQENARTAPLPPGSCLADGHVHLHGGARPGAVLDRAASEFRDRGAACGLRFPGPGILLLAEAEGNWPFEDLCGLDSTDRGAWRITPTLEPHSVRARRSDGAELILMQGRQVETREGLEVLALICPIHIPDHLGIKPTLDLAQAAGAINVLPWCFGKWWLRRGRIATRVLGSGRWPLFVGDMPHRPTVAPMPRLLKLCQQRGIPLLPGSAPLPFPWSRLRVGRYGFVVSKRLDPARPAADLARWLRNLRAQPAIFGGTAGWLSFAWNQTGMQLRKRYRHALTSGPADRAEPGDSFPSRSPETEAGQPG